MNFKHTFTILIFSALAVAIFFHEKTNAFLIRITSNQLVNACEDRILGKIRSPSTYRRASSSVDIKRASIEEMMRYDKRLFEKSRTKISSDTELDHATKYLIKKHNGPYKRMVLISFDSQNGYGAVIRTTYMCTDVQVSKDWKGSHRSFLLNGKSYWDRF